MAPRPKARPPIWLCLTMAVANVVALADLPYGYYQLLRLVVTGYAIWLAFWWSGTKVQAWMWIFGFVAIIYNPVFKISMSREVHSVVNVLVAVLIVAELAASRKMASAVE